MLATHMRGGRVGFWDVLGCEGEESEVIPLQDLEGESKICANGFGTLLMENSAWMSGCHF